MAHLPSPMRPNTARSFDTIIIGAGSMGLPTAYNLALQGQKVLVLDRYQAPHVFGSHHGTTRLLRVAYVEGSVYVPMVQRARQLWIELEEIQRDVHSGRENESLFAPVGILSAMPADSLSYKQIQDCVKRYGIPYELMNPEEAMKRWPGISIPDHQIVHFDPLGGIVFSEACLRQYQELCTMNGVTCRFGGELQAIEVGQSSVTVQFGNETFSAATLLVSTGAGTPGLLGRWFPDWRVPLQPLRKVVAWFPNRADGGQVSAKAPYGNPYSASRFPGYSIEDTEGWFYGFPDFGDGLKVGRHDGAEPCDPETINRSFTIGSDEELDLRSFVSRYFPHAAGPATTGSVCMYTMTPDENFVIDTHPEHSHVFLATGFSGHGFKFASAIGEVLAERIVGRDVRYDLSFFSAGRF